MNDTKGFSGRQVSGALRADGFTATKRQAGTANEGYVMQNGFDGVMVSHYTPVPRGCTPSYLRQVEHCYQYAKALIARGYVASVVESDFEPYVSISGRKE